jgi:hypothetical protein
MLLISGQLYGDNLKNIIETLTGYTTNKKEFVILPTWNKHVQLKMCKKQYKKPVTGKHPEET